VTDSTIAIAGTHVTRPHRLPRRLPTDADMAAHRPVQVVWELTLACNLRCVHCGSRAGRKREGELSTAECLDVVRQLAELGTRQITLIGGEAYLRKDWLIIAKAIADAGIHCGIQSGARALTEERIRAAVEAGIGTLGVSIDGPREIHDRQRGVKGSFDHALRALRFANAAGIKPGVNTQINALSKPHLREIFDTIVEHGARFWQVQITVAMGNAVDNDAMLLQPHEIPETLDVLADLFERGRQIGFRLIPGNNVGYYGPHEYMWRTITSEPEHWAGCTAGENSLGLEADGKIKSCPSLPADPYGGGNARTVSIRDAMAALVPTTTRLDRTPAGGFCGSCYYWNVCRGGCTWVTHGLSGKRGDNPYCYYRARELAKKGLRERIVKVAEAPGEPFDFGRFEIVVEDANGQRVPTELACDDKKRPRGRKLELCTGCREFIFASERICPHCGAAHRPERTSAKASSEPAVQSLVDEIDAHARRMHELVYGPALPAGARAAPSR
jgi:radical SAM protein with 4Fe4S-binding SPASM domain